MRYPLPMDDLDAGAQPRCPTCRTVTRPTARANVCPGCGWREEIPWARKSVDDPGIVDFPGVR